MTEAKSDVSINFDNIPALIPDSDSEDDMPDLICVFGDTKDEYHYIKGNISEHLPFSDFLKALNIIPDDFKSFHELRTEIFKSFDGHCIRTGCLLIFTHSLGFDKNGKPAISCRNHRFDFDTDGQLVLSEDRGLWYPEKNYKSRGGG